MHKDKLSQRLCSEISALLVELFRFPKVDVTEEWWACSLTSQHFCLSGLDLAYLFFEVEKRYAVRFECGDLDDSQFNSIESIAHLLAKRVKKD